jgi:hypothetical protein
MKKNTQSSTGPDVGPFLTLLPDLKILKHWLKWKMAVFWVVAPCSLVEVYRRFRGADCLHLMMENNPEDSHLRTHRRENLKSYIV